MTFLKCKAISFWMIVLTIGCIQSNAQFTQRIRGAVVDQVLQKPLAGATVTLVSLNKTTTTDSLGNFRFSDVPLGNQQILVSHVGFKEAFTENIIVNAGKEVVLNIIMENIIRSENEVVVKTNSKKTSHSTI
jgi:hypothetical protein